MANAAQESDAHGVGPFVVEGTMRIGLQLPSFCFAEGPPGIAARLREIAQAAEEGGFSSL